MIPKPDRHQPMRDALRDLCAAVPADYHRTHGQNATYPEEFIDALTRAGWLAAVELKDAIGRGLAVKPIRNMVNHETNELFFDELEIPAENLIGEEGRGFHASSAKPASSTSRRSRRP